MDIVLFGAGNVATVLGKKIKAAGHTILQIIGPTYEHTQKLARELESPLPADSNEILRSGDLYILAIPDRALENIGGKLGRFNNLFVHTAGSVSKEVLSSITD